MRVFSVGLLGTEPFLIEIEGSFSRGLPSVTFIGLPPDQGRELRDRVTTAVHSLSNRTPEHKATICFTAPHDIRLSRLGTDWLNLPVALLMLAAQNRALASLLQRPDHMVLAAGQLTLTGSIRPLTQWAPLACLLEQRHKGLAHASTVTLVIPPCTSPFFESWAVSSYPEGTTCDGSTDERRPQSWLRHYTVTHLSDVHQIPNSNSQIVCPRRPTDPYLPVTRSANKGNNTGDEQGDDRVRLIRSARDPFLAVAALCAKSHRLHALFAGPPGVGKTHLAELIAKEQTPPSQKESATLALIHGESSPPTRPTRKPHHSATLQSLTGGARLNIGELGLAHAGILLLDELAEFPAPTLDALREPMDDGMVRLSRAQGQINYPAGFQLIATMNPCPCGYFFSSVRRCRCLPSKVRTYLGKARGPLLDRFHMLVWLDPNDPTYARANSLCAALIGGNEVTTEQLPTQAPNGVSNRSAERTRQLLECLEDHFPASPLEMRIATAGHLRHLGTMIREIDGLI